LPTPPKKTAASQAAQKITAWSFSRLNDYRKCPRFAYFKHVQRLKEPGNEAMERGGAIGEMAERFAQAKGAKARACPPELATFEEEFRALQRHKVLSEQDWAFTSGWEPTGWFDRDAWCRVKVDAFYMFKEAQEVCGKVIDYKTGKVREAHEEQIDLYALAAMLKFPEVVRLFVELWYLDQGVMVPAEPRVYTRADIPALKKSWEKATAPMLRDTRFPEKTSKACTWCHYRKSNAGPCKY
jgi:RecB family exonuclease